MPHIFCLIPSRAEDFRRQPSGSTSQGRHLLLLGLGSPQSLLVSAGDPSEETTKARSRQQERGVGQVCWAGLLCSAQCAQQTFCRNKRFLKK